MWAEGADDVRPISNILSRIAAMGCLQLISIAQELLLLLMLRLLPRLLLRLMPRLLLRSLLRLLLIQHNESSCLFLVTQQRLFLRLLLRLLLSP